jgi:hypothetical protein
LQEVLNFIEERLGELEKEKEELTEYEQLDKHRRALEFNLYDKELSKATEALGAIEVTREEEREKQQGLHARLRGIQDELQVEEESLVTVRQAIDRLSIRRAEKAADLAETVAKRSAIEVELQETEVCIILLSLVFVVGLGVGLLSKFLFYPPLKAVVLIGCCLSPSFSLGIGCRSSPDSNPDPDPKP